MNDDALRAAVREAIERHLGRQATVPAAIARPAARAHVSHLTLAVAPGSVGFGGRCLIEPAVDCNECGYCQSYGH